ncbi:MAG: tRNA dihydrouridine synthase DusB [Armatimonadetes bacterium]|nr:tRNA dihydrouridine synthase DusB [Armatimonadota bacterium]
MAGVTNHAFRLICRHHGAAAVWTEMISSYGLRYRNSKTLRMFDWTDEERPVIVQIFGADTDTMASAAAMAEAVGADAIDINLGCPVRKVVRTGAGAALMQNLEQAREVMSAVVQAVSIPVTVKTRKGPDDKHVTAIEVARIAEEVGIAAVTIHGRTAAQGYSGTADWNIIADVKKAVRIPVIGNGDVKSPQDAVRMLTETGCDAVMIGRAALGNPWIFSRTAHYIATGEIPPEPSCAERMEVAREHLRLMTELYGEERGVREMRGQLAWYIKSIPGASQIRRAVSSATTLDEMLALTEEACKQA